MPKFPIPATIDQAPAASRALLRTAEARFGRVPNMALLLSASPAALQGYLALLTALDGGTLGARTSERIALAVAEAIGCQYGLSLHTFRARNGIGLDDAEIHGYDDAQIIEIVLHAGLNMLAGTINKVCEPDVDFPLIQPRKAD